MTKLSNNEPATWEERQIRASLLAKASGWDIENDQFSLIATNPSNVNEWWVWNGDRWTNKSGDEAPTLPRPKGKE